MQVGRKKLGWQQPLVMPEIDPSHPLAGGLVIDLPVICTARQALDASLYRNHGTLLNGLATAWTDKGLAFNFTSGEDCIECPNNQLTELTGSDSFTFSFWFKGNIEATTYNCLLGKTNGSWVGAGYGMFWLSGSEIRFFCNTHNTTYAAKTGLTSTNWNFFVVSRFGGTTTLYANDTAGSTTTSVDPSTAPDDKLYIGTMDDSNLAGFSIDGKMPGFRMWRRGFTGNQITNLRTQWFDIYKRRSVFLIDQPPAYRLMRYRRKRTAAPSEPRTEYVW